MKAFARVCDVSSSMLIESNKFGLFRPMGRNKGISIGILKERRKVMSKKLFICLALVLGLASVALADLKVDFGDEGQRVKGGYQEFTGEHNTSAQSKDFNFDGTNITVNIATGSADDVGFRDYTSEGGGEPLGADFVYANDNNGSDAGRVILTLAGLPAGDYTLVSYHNDTKNTHDPQDPINVSVGGAVSASTGADNVAQSKSTSDDNLAQSTVTFTATGGDVVITYTPTTNNGVVSKAVLNGFDLSGGGGVVDLCPDDPAKTEPGVCGCGVADDDSDGDGTEDCIDLCPDDPDKVDEGVCGCGVADEDSDGDGAEDCIDPCPDDPADECEEECTCPGDMNADGQIDLEDLQALATVLLEAGSPFIVQCD